MRYFPLTADRFEHQFGIRALPGDESILEATDRYADEIALKRRLLGVCDQQPGQPQRRNAAADLENYYQALPGSVAAQREAAKVLIEAASFLSPTKNDATGQSFSVDEARPLLSVAAQVQEDLVILSGDPEAGHRVIAGVVCFPSGWTIRDKIGQSILKVHAPVPAYESVMSSPTDRLLARLKPGRPVWRTNWGVRASDRLDQSPPHATELQKAVDSLTASNVGDQCQFRVERQTLSRLAETGHILFTIHTHQCSLADLDAWQKENLLGVLRTAPVETLRYKGITPINELVQRFLSDELKP